MSDLKTGALHAMLTGIAKRYPGAAIASSMQMEDMILTDVVGRLKLPLAIFMLDTGRLHSETLAMVGRVKERYAIEVEIYQPQDTKVKQYVQQHGLNAFYESVELRKDCCGIRKVEPLARALRDRPAWVTGQRRAQSVTRTDLKIEDFDSTHGLPKFNPLTEWTDAEVRAYISAFDVPVNALHARGYPSIGCEPCTRAIKPGEDPRAGRWWWESSDSKECGLHIIPIKQESHA
ncbi:MAG TPA: phosphoadenylyl-sulfate reductase [Burkholderiaceae bacterium]|nr:phosphoadenylyl-sulfate reductase [Burkholderiaceae bacterium]